MKVTPLPLVSIFFTSCGVTPLVTVPLKLAGDVAEGAYKVGKGTVSAVTSSSGEEE